MQNICCAYQRKEGEPVEDKMHLSIRMDKGLHDKIQYVAGSEGRSMSGQILYLIQKCVREYEKEHGPIPEDELG